jgi:hypothetical protein
MNVLNRIDRQDITNDINDRVAQAMDLILAEQSAALVGQKVGIHRREALVEATIIGLKWTYDNAVLLELEYIDPVTGRTHRTDDTL